MHGGIELREMERGKKVNDKAMSNNKKTLNLSTVRPFNQNYASMHPSIYASK